jgi:hypothetical protein
MARRKVVMKKAVMFALLLAGVTASASAEIVIRPREIPDRYTCYYSNYTGPAVSGNQGYSEWDLVESTDPSGRPMLRGVEYFLATFPNGTRYRENYKATWAKPEPAPYHPFYGSGTRWEFTFNPYGPQCKQTDVYLGGAVIFFRACTDGHTRNCWLQ